ncbi:MAG TPA: sugar ABC transporter permease [Devosiaceae bacterium]|nr:sugar ABC transporter permease [Devosiaceae bacterium]
MTIAVSEPRLTFRQRLAVREIDGVSLLVVPALLVVIALFVYPFLYGVILSLQPMKGGGLFANYIAFFSDPYSYNTILLTLNLALPVTVFSLVLALPIAFRVRLMKRQRILTTILVIPITLGTVLVADGLLNYLGPQGWFNRVLLAMHLIAHPLRMTHNYWGVFVSLLITGFPFTFLMTLSYVSGVDPALERAGATLGAGAARRFWHIYMPLLVPGLAINFCLSFVQNFSVFPSAELLGAPAGETRVMAIAAYEAAFQHFDYSMGSAIAIIMAIVQLVIVGLVLAGRNFFYRGSTTGGKG